MSFMHPTITPKEKGKLVVALEPVTELIAEELHRHYRAAAKALGAPGKVNADHNHGWEACWPQCQRYFRRRAALLIKRAHCENPETLGEAEQILAATVLLRRLSAEGKLVVPVRAAYYGALNAPYGPSFYHIMSSRNPRPVLQPYCLQNNRTDAARKAARDATVRKALGWSKKG